MKTYICVLVVLMVVFAVVGMAEYHLFKIQVIDQLAAVNAMLK